jgi:predicted MPP superfamily phosphohydrolase
MIRGMAKLPISPASFPFTVINDLHYTELACRPWLEGLVREINATPADLVLVLGDLAETGSAEELSIAKEILGGLTVPYFTVPGNHDGPPERPISDDPKVLAAGLADYERLFPGRRNYTFMHKGWQFIALDTTNGSGYQKLPIPTETRAFARRAAQSLDPKLPTILFTHMPLNPEIRFASADGYALLEDLAGLNLRIVFSGHFHGRTRTAAPSLPTLTLLTNTTCSRSREIHDGTTERGYYQCQTHIDGTVAYTFVEYCGDQRG